jgi:hypothetical protein
MSLFQEMQVSSLDTGLNRNNDNEENEENEKEI